VNPRLALAVVAFVAVLLALSLLLVGALDGLLGDLREWVKQ
jgi:hypothetical protein